MRIQHNIAALNAYRQLSGNNNAVSKNLEKLSSGYKINRAGDDAAGLAISEKMRAQITGLKTAQKNANDGISLVQTAEGALTEVHSMLNRMVELATQSSNGTYDNATDRANLQKEVETLKEEINRISESTNFNGIQLLDGTMGEAVGAVIGANNAVAAGALASIMDGSEVIQEGKLNAGTSAVTATNQFYFADEIQVSKSATTTGSANNFVSFDITVKDKDGNAATLNVTIYTTSTGTGAATASLAQLATALDGIIGTSGSTTATSATAALGAGLEMKVDLSVTAGEFNNLKDLADKLKVTVGASGTLNIDAQKAGAGQEVTLGNFAAKSQSDIDKMEERLNENFDGQGEDKLKLGTKTKESMYGRDEVKANYTLASTEFKLKSGASAHGSALKIGDKVYIMQQKGKELDAALKAHLKTMATGSYEIVEFDASATSGNEVLGTKLAQTINNNFKGAAATALEANLEAKFDATTGKLTIKETAAFGLSVTSSSDPRIHDKTEMQDLVTESGISLGAKNANQTIKFDSDLKEGTYVTVGNKTYQFLSDPTKAGKGVIGIQFQAGNPQANAQALLTELQKDTENGLDTSATLDPDDTTGTTIKIEDAQISIDAHSEGLMLQVGDTSDDYQKVRVVVRNMDTKSLGIDNINVGSQDGAADAIDLIKNAINKVSSTRGDLGAIQNRLEHTINNLGVTTENMTAAESRIRDTDMAEEMMAYTKNNILVQSAQAMLAQANTIPQGVLQLLG